jgi:homoserine dehydrogenase
VKLALLGVGHVGSAVAAMVRRNPLANRFRLASGLVREVNRTRAGAEHVTLTSDPAAALSYNPDIVIEALGGLEPARTLVLRAIERRIPVVTANKSLLAAHGGELLEAAERQAVPLRYEAAVLAGVPFLGTFHRRPLVRAITAISGIVNGTTNFILSKMSDDGTDFGVALAEAQRHGYAEPDPASDISGTDAAEKLCVLVRHFADTLIGPAQIDRTGICRISPGDLNAACEFGGAIKPIVHAEWQNRECSAFAGPAFVPNEHPLSRIRGVQNAVLLRNGSHGDLFFAGPGAGPEVTAATLLDDAIEIVEEGFRVPQIKTILRAPTIAPPSTAWFVRIRGASNGQGLPSALGLLVKRAVSGPEQTLLLTHPCERDRICSAIRELDHRRGCGTFAFRALAEN